MWYEWFFDGFGTEIVSLVIGMVIGVVGDKVYMKNRNKQSQKSGDNSKQIQLNIQDSNGGTSANVVAGDQTSHVGDVIFGNKVISEMDEFDIRNFPNYNNAQIEGVISKGNDATIRSWCLELIVNKKPDYLIRRCLENMKNEKEKYKLLEELVNRGYEASCYCRQIDSSLQNACYQTEAIKLYLSKQLFEYIKPIFINIDNNKYIYECLKEIYSVNNKLFKDLYNKGKCFSNQQYYKKMKIWIKQQNA